MDYSKLSDFEINKLVAEKLDLRLIHERAGVVCYTSQGGTSCFFDPCNNPSDAWPIIVQNKISVIWVSANIPNKWEAVAPNHIHIDANSSNPLRAAMIVFLMMNDEAH